MCHQILISLCFCLAFYFQPLKKVKTLLHSGALEKQVLDWIWLMVTSLPTYVLNHLVVYAFCYKHISLLKPPSDYIQCLDR